MERSIGYTVIQSQVSSKIYDALNINERAPITIKPSIISKEGRLEHILGSRKINFNDEFISDLQQTLTNPLDADKVNDAKHLNRYVIYTILRYKTHKNKECPLYMAVYADKEEN